MKYRLIFTILSNILFDSCDYVDTIIKYQSCCGAEPVEFVKDSYNIYVPNCFTPNGDNVNDIFWPSLSSNIEYIKTYEIYSGDNDYLNPLFISKNFNVYDLQTYGWYGWNLNYSRYVGKSKNKMIFIGNDSRETAVQGYGCSILCGESAKIFNNKQGCYFPTQGNQGKLIKNLPVEEDCF